MSTTSSPLKNPIKMTNGIERKNRRCGFSVSLFIPLVNAAWLMGLWFKETFSFSCTNVLGMASRAGKETFRFRLVYEPELLIL